MSLLSRIRRRASDDRGAVLVMMAFALPAIIGFAILVVDGGNWFAHKRHLQLQADAGALAGGSYFQDCIGNTAAASTQIAGAARLYAGDPGVVGAYNGQIGNANKGSIVVLLNSKTFAAKSPPPDDTIEVPQDQPTLCDAKQLDVKITEEDLPFFLKKLAVVPAINAQARVEIQKVGTEYDVRPIAIRDDSYYQCAQAQLFNTDANGNPTTLITTIPLGTRTVLPDLSTQFQNPGGSGDITMPNTGSAHVSVRILLGNTGCVATDGYADPTGGVNFINIYAVAGSQDPVIHSVSLPPGQSNCTPDPYFSTNACTVVVKAYVGFAGSPITGGANQNAFVTIGGQSASAGSDAGGLYWTASFAIPAQSGPKSYSVSAEQQYGSTSKGACTNKNNNPCKFSFGLQQQSFSATDDDSGINSGSIKMVEIGELGQSTLGANSFQKSTQHNLVITVQVRGLGNSLPTDPPIVLRNSNQNSKRNGLIDCGQGNGASADYDAILNGCPVGMYIWPTGTPCVVLPANPIDCVSPISGNRRQKIASAIKDRINGSCNNWNAYRDSNGATPIPPNDPRAITMVITSPADLSGNGNGPPIPILAFGTFYVTGYDGGSGNGTGCQNEPYPGTGSDKFQVWGHWIKYIIPSGSGSGSGDLCIYGDFGNCVPVLTR